ncbi:hypothetical protein [Arthrobacter koreensis]|uniref:hypothetical protein n=1 Tax=Arthrobacter koreensis TaxID=199136 RepID=UPI0038209FAE
MLLGGLFTFVGVSYAVMNAQQYAEINAQEQQVAALEERMQAELSTAEAARQTVVDSALGASGERIAGDTKQIHEFVKKAVTWGSGTEYAEARESLMRRYSLGEDTQFMREYFQEPVYNTDSSGQRFYLVDAEGLNSQLGSIEVKSLGVLGTEYRYMVLADITSSSNDGKASATRTSVIYLTLDGEGAMSDVSGYASVSAPLTSG